MLTRYRKSLLVVAAVLALAGIRYAPVLRGNVPLPMDIVFSSPPWESQHVALPASPHAEMGDLVTQGFPWRAHSIRLWREGLVPLWNRHALLGTPHLANAQSAVMYPPHLILALLPTSLGWSVAFLLRFVLAAGGMYVFQRNIGLGRTSALCSAIVFSNCAFLVAWDGWSHVDSALWLPAMLWSIDRLRAAADLRRIVLCGLLFALPVLAGHPELAFYVCITGALYAVYRLFVPADATVDAPSPDAVSRRRFALFFCGAALVAVALAAVQWAPTLEWLSQTRRDLSIRWITRPPSEIVSLFSRDLRSNPNGVGVAVPEGALYVGMLALFASFCSVLRGRRRTAIFFMLVLASALSISYGVGPAYWLSTRIPILQGLPNTRMLFLAQMSLAVLAGIGLDAIARVSNDTRRFHPWAACLDAATLVAVVGITCLFQRSTTVGLEFWRSPMATATFATVSVICLRPWFFAAVPMAPRIITVLCAIEMLSFSVGNMPTFPASQIYPEPPVYAFLRQQSAPAFRVASVDAAATSNIEMMFGLDAPTGYDFTMRRTWDLLAPLAESDPPGSLSSTKIVGSRSRLLDLLGVRYLVASNYNQGWERLTSDPSRFREVFHDAHVEVFENASALPRAFLVSAAGIQYRADGDETRRAVLAPGFDPSTEVVLSTQSASLAPSPVGAATPAGVVDAIDIGDSRIRVGLAVAAAGILVVTDVNYPGWTVEVDGAPRPVMTADHAFKAVAVKPGDRWATFSYAPASFAFGGALSLVSLLFAVTVLASTRARSRSQTPRRN